MYHTIVGGGLEHLLLGAFPGSLVPVAVARELLLRARCAPVGG